MIKQLLAVAFLVSGLAHAAPAAGPDVLVKQTTDEILEILRDDKAIRAGDVARANALVEEKVLPNFDFNRMTQLAMGRNWPRATPQQKQQLVSEFRTLLVRTYASALTRFSGQTVEFKPYTARPGDNDVTVRSQVVQPGGKPLPIDYSLYKSAFGWKVYDVSIENVSLIANYRASFAATIRQSGIDGLIQSLAQQTSRLGKPGA